MFNCDSRQPVSYTHLDVYKRQVEEVLGFLRQVANKTRMIGLNAAIEAARVGQSRCV